jgi:hypothetical protein
VVARLDALFKDSVCTAASKALIADACENFKSRGSVYNLFAILGQFDHFPSSSKEAVEEWKAKKHVRAEASSFLVRAAEFVQAIALTEGCALALHAEDFECTLRMDEVDGVLSLTGNYNIAKSVCKDLGSMPLRKHIQNLLCGSVEEALSEFSESLFLNSLKLDAKSVLEDAGETSLSHGLDCMIDKVSLGDGIKYATKLFATGAKQSPGWVQQSLASLVADLLDVLPASTPVTLRSLCKNGDDCSWTDKDHIIKACSMYSLLGQLVITVGYLRAKCFGSEVVHKLYKLKPEVSDAVSVAKFTASKLLVMLNSEFAKSRHMKDVPWLVGVATMTEWTSLVSSLIPRVGHDLLVKTLVSVMTLSAELEKVTPRHEHIVNDERFNRQLANRHLLQWPSRSTLNEKASLLFGALADMQRLQTQWSLSPSLQELEDSKESLAIAEARFNSAKQAITIIAGVDVVLAKKGDEQVSFAVTLVASKSAALPKALLAELEKLARKQSPQVAAVAASSNAAVVPAPIAAA